MTRPAAPPAQVLGGFGAGRDIEPLAGGTGLSVLAGGTIVLKPIDDPTETEWVQGLTERLEQDGFRVAQPVRSNQGGWVVAHWCASQFIEGLTEVAPDWDRVIDAGMRFSEAATRALDGSEHILARRTHRWARADRVAWGEGEETLTVPATELRQHLGGESASDVLIHGDLSGNVFADPDGTPVVLDISPYLRPARWASAIVVADAVLWNGADLARANAFVDADRANLDLLARALIVRMVSEQLADAPPPWRRARAVPAGHRPAVLNGDPHPSDATRFDA